ERSNDRLLAPLSGLADAWRKHGAPGAFGFVVAVVLCVGAWVLARRDVLTWVATAYLAFALTFSADVWLRGGYTRTLVPLFVFGLLAVVGGWRTRSAASADAGTARATMSVTV